MRRLRAIAVAASLALVSCAAPRPIPDFTYYRLPSPQHAPPLAAPLFKQALVVEPLTADGLYADKALIYALSPDALELRQYHYQLWTDPPTRILQRRLMARLREAGLALLVTDGLAASATAVRISGVILRFDRVPDGSAGFDAVVTLKLRADGPAGVPLVDEYYRARKPSAGPDLKATVDAFGVAIDDILSRFEADLRRHGDVRDAR